ncbi:DUF4159 domain-containing protein [Sinomicrobium weinanense]|uniref:DUF4159 domain-containing protein n=1 Tax=Sinomicrobium weinanense TaxID=2842200 RepID=A0A926JQG7_9FLAO|nr:DUF4159 domain-containing protein [Sinomicrobium weinanense]MBC9795499.1 DUF4159 domain-containing protein [Sinomicrobium weinanense]MBU3123354.1 DUF4159 domain-containing protein [Sinomicrobium weinanense]
MRKIIFIPIFFLSSFLHAQEVALLKYGGGGDWYANPTALPNLIAFCNSELGTGISKNFQTVEAGSMDIFQYPFLHMTGHGNVFFTREEAENLHTYLLSGGFLHIDDNYGMKPYLEKELLKIFPDKEWEELPANHPIFHQKFRFPNGLPKIHEHDNKPPQAFGYFHEGRLILLFTHETDLGDGWEDPEVHNDPEEIRQKALRMGANIIQFVFEN